MNAPSLDLAAIDDFVEAVFTSPDKETVSPIWEPFPGKPQESAYYCTADVIGYGGAGGGGKTDLALGKAFTQFYESIIFRREYPQLKHIIKRGNEIQDGRCRFIAGEKKHWVTPDQRTVELGAMQYDDDKFAYKGRPHDFIAFDEAADFLESQVRFAFGWLRTTRLDVKPQGLLMFNPPTTEEGEWIIQYFAPWLDPNHPNPAAPGELRWYVRIDDDDVEVPDGQLYVDVDSDEIDAAITRDGYYTPEEVHSPQSRTFFPARVEDNPVYMATGYDRQLESLPEPLRSQLRFGDFTAGKQDDAWQVIPTEWVLAAQKRWQEGQRPDVGMRACGVDVARGGSDQTALAPLYGNWFDSLILYPGENTPDGATTARYVTDLVRDDTPIFIDVIGYGASAYDHLAALPGVNVTPVNASAGTKAIDQTGRYQFFNVRAEMYWRLREALDPESGENLCLPPDRRVRTDLCAPRYRVVSGKYQVEPKEDIVKRIGYSPDYGDAIALAWYGAINRPIAPFRIRRIRRGNRTLTG